MVGKETSNMQESCAWRSSVNDRKGDEQEGRKEARAHATCRRTAVTGTEQTRILIIKIQCAGNYLSLLLLFSIAGTSPLPQKQERKKHREMSREKGNKEKGKRKGEGRRCASRHRRPYVIISFAIL